MPEAAGWDAYISSNATFGALLKKNREDDDNPKPLIAPNGVMETHLIS